jgi:hypothetical protein
MFVPQIHNLAKSFFEYIWEVVPFDNLVRLAFVDHKEQLEPTTLTRTDCHFAVTPFVVVVLIQ